MNSWEITPELLLGTILAYLIFLSVLIWIGKRYSGYLENKKEAQNE